MEVTPVAVTPEVLAVIPVVLAVTPVVLADTPEERVVIPVGPEGTEATSIKLRVK